MANLTWERRKLFMWTRRGRPCGVMNAASSKRLGLGYCNEELRRCISFRRHESHVLQLGLVLVNRTFRMPNLDEVLPTERDSVADKVMPPRRSVTRVLVVDDELAACKLLCIMLGPPDY